MKMLVYHPMYCVGRGIPISCVSMDEKNGPWPQPNFSFAVEI